MSKIALRMENVEKSFPGVQALNDVTFEAHAGEATALIGANGAGKSTLMNILAGVIQQDGGKVYIGGELAKINHPVDASKYGITFVHQEMAMLPTLTIAENMFISTFPKRAGFIDYKKAHAMCAEALGRLGCHFPPDIRVSHLSPGDRQIVEIARALLSNPQVVIFDEPTSSLTTREKQRLFNVIRTLKKENVTIIYITHLLDEVFEICERAYVLRNGETAGGGLIKDLTYRKVVELMIGTKKVTDYFGHKTRKAGEVILKVENLSSEGMLANINFELRKGEVLGLWGLLGSGRTELLRAVIGLDSIDSGTFSIKDNGSLRTFKPKEAKKWMTNLSLANLQQMVKVWPLVDGKLEYRLAQKFVDRLGIMISNLDQKVSTLSGGNQQKVVVARWLERNPIVFFMDEPTRGLDVGAKAEIRNIINELAEGGSAILVVSSEIEQIMAISDRYLVMSRGQIVSELPKDATKDELITAAAGTVANNNKKG